MNRAHAVNVDQDLAVVNAQPDAPILDEDAWEEAVDDSGVDTDMLCHSQWRSSPGDFD